MYLHLGQDTAIRTEDIIGIFDLDNTTISKNTRNYLARAQKEGQIINVTYELPKTFVVCRKKGRYEKSVVYISQISSATLLKRTGFVSRLGFGD